jgi:hypothetical protein
VLSEEQRPIARLLDQFEDELFRHALPLRSSILKCDLVG